MSGNCSTDINPVEIGCVDETAEPHKLLSRVFPSKVGGKPAWLALCGLPGRGQLRCDACQGDLLFLLQVYCPIESGSEDSSTFHRALFLFMCPNGSCYGKAGGPAPFKVFRSQLPRANEFYTSEAPNYEADRAEVVRLAEAGAVPDPAIWQPVCALCGCAAAADGPCVRCPECPPVPGGSGPAADAGRYCCAEHLAADAERHAALRHRPEEPQESAGESLLRLWTAPGVAVPGCTLAELGLLVGPDPRGDASSSASSGSPSSSPWASGEEEGEGDIGGAVDPRHRQSSPTPESQPTVAGAPHGNSGSGIEDFAAGLEDLAAKETPELRCLGDFKRATRREPGQVFRYHRRGQPLPICADPLPNAVPACELCGSPRVFECQVLPQLLSWLRLDGDGTEATPDFGTVLVYTCGRSCRPKDRSYAREFVAVQYV